MVWKFCINFAAEKILRMRKALFLAVMLLAAVGGAWGQFSIRSSAAHTLLTGAQYNIDAIAVFDSIPAGSEIVYNGAGPFQWSYMSGGTRLTSTQAAVEAEDGVLYTVSVNGVATYWVYVLDYSKYHVTFESIWIPDGQTDLCESLQIGADGDVPAIYYLDKNGNRTFLQREFHLEYMSASWSGDDWLDSLAVVQLTPSSWPLNVTLKAPMESTDIILWGDTIASLLGIAVDTISIEYRAVALECHPEGKVIERSAKNEKDRSSQNAIQGSSPLVVQFSANANPADPVYYEWRIYNVDDSMNYQRYSDPVLNYTFKESGEYVAKLMVNTDECSYTDTLNIKVLDSFLEVPNVFTPNGDGINDEFRVAYKSLESFEIWVYNRWGRLVYHSTDPGKGWDGNINGRPAAVGTYYYVILAFGSDEDMVNYRRRGKPMRYKLAGDINLLR